MAKIQAVVFDLFKTLIYQPDNEKQGGYRDLIHALGFKDEDYQNVRKIIMREAGLSDVAAIARRLAPDRAEQIDLPFFQKQIDRRIGQVRWYDETVFVLEKLKSRGLKIGLISNLSQPFARPFFDLGLAAYFDVVFFSFELGLLKPDQLLYHMMITKLGLPAEQIIMTGDQFSKDVEAPRKEGMQAVLLDRSGQEPGSIKTLEGIFDYL